MKCPHCQRENPEGVKFCGGRGRSLQLELICSKCGYKNPPDIQFCYECGQPLSPALISPVTSAKPPVPPQPAYFAGGRYKVKKFLGEGGKKKVYLAHDSVLDRDVAFALIKTEKLDDETRMCIIREARAMGVLCSRIDLPRLIELYKSKRLKLDELVSGRYPYDKINNAITSM